MTLTRKLMATVATCAVVGTMMIAATGAQAQEAAFKTKQAGDILIRGRVIGVVPDEDTSTSDIATGEGKVSNDYVPEVDFSYFITDNIALELIAATTKHDVKWQNPNVDLGSVNLLPPTLTVQYHFLSDQRFSPYVGAGLNYTMFYNEKSGGANSVNYDNGFGYAFQAGFDYAISGPWSLNFDVKKLFLNTTVTADLGGASPAKVDVDLDPWIFGIGVGYRF